MNLDGQNGQASAGGADAGAAQGGGNANNGQQNNADSQGNTGQSGNNGNGSALITGAEGAQANGNAGQQGGNAAGDAGANAQQGNGAGGKHWSADAPEGMRKVLEGFAKPEDAMSALERGKAYVPVASADAVKVAFPEGMPVDTAMLGSYKEFAAKAGFTQEQAQLAADYYLQQQVAQRKAEFDNAVTSLNSAWGDKFDANAGKVNRLVEQLDSKMGGELQAAMNAGLGNNPALAKALLIVADAMGETQFGGNAGMGSPGGGKPMSTEEHLKNNVFKAS